MANNCWNYAVLSGDKAALDEMYALESTEGECASCESNVGKYNGYWDEFICEGCTEKLGA